MNPDDLAKILDELGQRLGPTGSHVFELAVRQQVLTGALWSLLLIGGAVAAAIIGMLTVRRVRRLESVIDGVEARIAAKSKEFASTADAVATFRKEQEAAQLDAMTAKQKADWYSRVPGMFGYGSFYFGSGISADLSDLHEANGFRLFVAFTAGVVSLCCVVLALLGPIPALLNPEYAALRDILGAIR